MSRFGDWLQNNLSIPIGVNRKVNGPKPYDVIMGLITLGFTDLKVIAESGDVCQVVRIDRLCEPVDVRDKDGWMVHLATYTLHPDTRALWDACRVPTGLSTDNELAQSLKDKTWFPVNGSDHLLTNMGFNHVGVRVHSLDGKLAGVLTGKSTNDYEFHKATTATYVELLITWDTGGFIVDPILGVEYTLDDGPQAVSKHLKMLSGSSALQDDSRDLLRQTLEDLKNDPGIQEGDIVKRKVTFGDQRNGKRIVVGVWYHGINCKKAAVLVPTDRGGIMEEDFTYNYVKVGHVSDLDKELRLEEFEGLTRLEWIDKYFVREPEVNRDASAD